MAVFAATLVLAVVLQSASQPARAGKTKVFGGAAYVSAGGGHVLVVKTDGTGWGWGYDAHGEITVAKGTTKPVRLKGISNLKTVAAGEYHSLAVKKDGTVWAWGKNDVGQLGNGKKESTKFHFTPAHVAGLKNVKAVEADVGRSYALLSNGTVYAWGANDKGQLGDGTTTGRTRPVKVSGLTGVTAIACGQNHAIALKKDGTVYTWGANQYGQAGNGKLSEAPQLTPKVVTGLPGKATDVAAGRNGDYNLVLMANGTVWAWGRNEYGDLGNGTTTGSTRPVQVKGITNATLIGASGGTGFGVTKDGTVYAWGDNKLGQLGNNSHGDHSATPVKVKGLKGGIREITGGGGYGVAIKQNRTMATWGSNKVGELGDGEDTGGNSFVPAAVIAPNASAAKTSSGTKIGPFSVTTFLLILFGAIVALALLSVPLVRRVRRGRRRTAVRAQAASGVPPAQAPGFPPAYAPRVPQAGQPGAMPPLAPAAPSVQAGPVADVGLEEYGRRILFLNRVDLFAGQPPELLARVAKVLRLIDVPAGGVVTRAGDAGDQFFLVESGTLAVTREFNGQVRELARLGAGDFFGEMALIDDGGHRTATVQATSPAQLWSLRASDFHELVGRTPELQEAVRRVAAQRRAGQPSGQFEVVERAVATQVSATRPIGIGRAPDNEIVFESMLVSGHHAAIEMHQGGFRIRDLNSTNGTFVNGVRIRVADLSDGDEVWVGDQRFIFDHRAIHRSVDPEGIRVDVSMLRKAVAAGKELLQDVTLSILPGEFIAVVGGSGAGKTTLLDAISGVNPPTSGEVFYNGRDYYRDFAFFRNVLGYVPQDDIIHTDLPLRVTLRHAARLRLPADTSEQDLDAAVDRTLAELELSAHGDTKVKLLSGGQRKRASIAAELLTRPRIFFLDEPTSGLDPYTESQMMALLRRLADGGSTVILTTHATKNVVLCDKVLFLTRGGYVAYFGTPHGALRYFGAQDFDQIYQRLADEASPEEWARLFLGSEDSRQVVVDRLGMGGAPAPDERESLGDAQGIGFRRQFQQFRVLTHRSFDLLRHNPVAIPTLVMPPILFTLLALAVFKSGAFKPVANSKIALQVLFLISFSAFIFGLLFAIQEIVKEFPIFRRERFVNLGIIPYVMSKMAILAPLLCALLILMLAILRITGRLPASGLRVYGEIFLTLALTGLVGLALALFTSALVSTTQQATGMLSVWIMPQVLFGGALLAVRQMGVVGKAIAAVAPVRWSFEELGHAVDLTGHFQTDTSRIGPGLAFEYANTFRRDPVQNWIILGLFLVAGLVLACVTLKRKTTNRARTQERRAPAHAEGEAAALA